MKMLEKLHKLGVNTPEVIFHTIPNDDVIRNEALKQYYSEQTVKARIRVLLRTKPSDKIETIVPCQLVRNAVMNTRPDEEMVMMKYPRHTENFYGSIVVGKEKYKITMYDKNRSIRNFVEEDYWKANPHMFESIKIVTDEMYRIREEIYGSTLIFSYFEKGCGMLNRKLLFWGM